MTADDVNDTGGIVPAWYRPPQPYTEGNDAAVTHGAFSEARWKPIAERIRAEYESDPDTPEWALSPKFRLTREAMYRAGAITELVGDWLDSIGIQAAAEEVIEAHESETGAAGGPRSRRARTKRTEPVLLLYSRLEGRYAMLRKSLAADPVAYAAVARDASLVRKHQDDNLEKMARIGAEIVKRREAELAAHNGQT